MRIREIDSSVRKSVLTGLIVSDQFLGVAAKSLDLDLLDEGPFRQIAQWCFDYHRKYKKAPKRQIESVYEAWIAKEKQPPRTANTIRDLLTELSDRYKSNGDLNLPFMLDQLEELIATRKLTRLRDSIEEALLRGRVREADAEVHRYKACPIGRNAGSDPLNEKAFWRRVFASPLEPLFTFPGEAGRFLNRAFIREGLVGIQAPEKRGKTYWCMELMFRALQHRRRVAFFSMGDLSEEEVGLRLGSRLEAKPIWDDQCGTIEIPKRIYGSSEDVQVEYRRKRCKSTISYYGALKACRRFMRGCGIRSGSTYLRISCHPTSSTSVRDIEGILDGWQVEHEFIPDVVIVDYADILAPEDSRLQLRDQINETWSALRRLSQQRRCLVIAPTQANRRAYEAEIQTMKYASEDKRKNAHVTGMLGLNQTPEQRIRGIMRLNWLLLRGAPYSERQCLHVGECRALSRAFCCGAILRSAMGEEDESSTEGTGAED